MVTWQNVAHYICAEPFKPFRITTTNGQVVEVPEPELIGMTVSTVRVLEPADPRRDENDKWHILPLGQIRSLEPVISSVV
jgi:hypothetical protein